MATTLGNNRQLVVACSIRSCSPADDAQAGYTVTLQQVGPNVVATGSGAINLTGLTFSHSGSVNPAIRPFSSACRGASIYTGPTSSSVDFYPGPVDR